MQLFLDYRKLEESQLIHFNFCATYLTILILTFLFARPLTILIANFNNS